jgi:hypothetical protein
VNKISRERQGDFRRRRFHFDRFDPLLAEQSFAAGNDVGRRGVFLGRDSRAFDGGHIQAPA